MPTFIDRVQVLPAELYNEIFDLTFTSHSTVRVNKQWEPTAALHVSKATRMAFRKSYFHGNMIFYVDWSVIQKWIRFLRDARAAWIFCEVRLADRSFNVEGMARRDLRMAMHRGYDDAVRLASDFAFTSGLFLRLRFQVVFGDPEKKVWMDLSNLRGSLDDMDSQENASATEWCESEFENGFLTS